MAMGNDNLFFSVIIPVYNVGKYLNDCLKSILDERVDDYEIILVDDGSTDGSSDLCDKYAEKHKEIHVIHKENEGLSEARNDGLKFAKGRYIVFIDSDDYICKKNFFRDAKRIIQDSKEDIDLVAFGYCKVFGSSRKVNVELPIKSEIEYCSIKDLIKNNCYQISAWTKIIRRELLMEHGISFRKGYTSEDIEWCARILVCGYNAIAWNTIAYAYRQRDGSITKTIKEKNANDVEYAVKQCIEMEYSYKTDQLEVLQAYTAKAVSMYIIIVAVIGRRLWFQKKEQVIDFANYLKHGRGIREKLIKWSLDYFGYVMTMRLLRLVFRFKNKRKKWEN